MQRFDRFLFTPNKNSIDANADLFEAGIVAPKQTKKRREYQVKMWLNGIYSNISDLNLFVSFSVPFCCECRNPCENTTNL
jgi:hypothetical protein